MKMGMNLGQFIVVASLLFCWGCSKEDNGECAVTSDCDPGFICYQRTCHQACGHDQDCDGWGEVCVNRVCLPAGSNTCRDASSCEDANPCTEDTCLENGQCQHTNVVGCCYSVTDCAQYPETPYCLDNTCVQCLENEDCSGDLFCAAGGSCNADHECEGGGGGPCQDASLPICSEAFDRCECDATSCPGDTPFCVLDDCVAFSGDFATCDFGSWTIGGEIVPSGDTSYLEGAILYEGNVDSNPGALDSRNVTFPGTDLCAALIRIRRGTNNDSLSDGDKVLLTSPPFVLNGSVLHFYVGHEAFYPGGTGNTNIASKLRILSANGVVVLTEIGIQLNPIGLVAKEPPQDSPPGGALAERCYSVASWSGQTVRLQFEHSNTDSSGLATYIDQISFDDGYCEAQ